MNTKEYLKQIKDIIDNLSDEEFIKLIKESYYDNAEFDKQMAEDLMYVSWEVDNLIKKE